jgi:hypothetical protein
VLCGLVQPLSTTPHWSGCLAAKFLTLGGRDHDGEVQRGHGRGGRCTRGLHRLYGDGDLESRFLSDS